MKKVVKINNDRHFVGDNKNLKGERKDENYRRNIISRT